jgi:hypothetical protein
MRRLSPGSPLLAVALLVAGSSSVPAGVAPRPSVVVEAVDSIDFPTMTVYFRVLDLNPETPYREVTADEVSLAEEGAPVEVGWRRSGGEAEVYLRDHGPGLTEEVRARVFEPFFTTKPRGTGLGLAIARDLAERLGGRLNLEPAPGGGTRACLRLPLLSDESEQMEPRNPVVRAA